MVECNFIEPPNINPNLNDQQLRINKVNEFKDYFLAEIKEIELMSKRLSKYIVYFDYFDLIILLKVTRNFVSACIIMEQIVIYFLMVQKLFNPKQKILKL